MSSRILKPWVESCGASCSKRSRRIMKKPLMGSAISTFSSAPGDLGCQRAGTGALLVETVGAAALDIAAADHEFRLAALQQRDHLRQLRFVVLQIGVDDRRIGSARGQDALDAGARQAAPADPADATDPRNPSAPGARTTSQVPSGELSSTKTTSQGMPASVASSRRYSTVTLSRSLKVGTTTESCGKPAACDRASVPGWTGVIHDGQRISAAAGHAKAGLERRLGGDNRPKQAQKCQRPRTEGARTSGAAKLFMVVPAPEL